MRLALHCASAAQQSRRNGCLAAPLDWPGRGRHSGAELNEGGKLRQRQMANRSAAVTQSPCKRNFILNSQIKSCATFTRCARRLQSDQADSTVLIHKFNISLPLCQDGQDLHCPFTESACTVAAGVTIAGVCCNLGRKVSPAFKSRTEAVSSSIDL